MFICSFILLCNDSFVYSFIPGKAFTFMFICCFMFLCIDSYIGLFNPGKTMNNLRNRRTVVLVTKEEKLKKLATQSSFNQFKIFNENLVAVEWANVELMLDRPIYVGFVILDLSKTLTYDLFPLQLHQEKVFKLDAAIYWCKFLHASNSNG